MSRKKVFKVKISGEEQVLDDINYLKISRITDRIGEVLEKAGEPLKIIQRAQIEILQSRANVFTREDYEEATPEDRESFLKNNNLPEDYFEKNETIELIPENQLNVSSQEILTH